MTPETWRVTVEYRTVEQARTAPSMLRGTAPANFRLEIIDNEGQRRWDEHGMLHLRPEKI